MVRSRVIATRTHAVVRVTGWHCMIRSSLHAVEEVSARLLRKLKNNVATQDDLYIF